MALADQLIAGYRAERESLLQQIAQMESGQLGSHDGTSTDTTQASVALAKRRLAEVESAIAQLAEKA